MKKIFFAGLVIISSCSGGLSGRIEKRQDGKFYLVNKSTDRAYQFTVKKTTVTDDTAQGYGTLKINLSPGDEYRLGVENEVSDIQYPTAYGSFLRFYRVVSEKEKKENFWNFLENKSEPYIMLVSKYDVSDFKRGGDTVINGAKVRYGYKYEPFIDSLHPLPRTYYKYKYEVTGQMELKKEDFDDKKEKKRK